MGNGRVKTGAAPKGAAPVFEKGNQKRNSAPNSARNDFGTITPLGVMKPVCCRNWLLRMFPLKLLPKLARLNRSKNCASNCRFIFSPNFKFLAARKSMLMNGDPRKVSKPTPRQVLAARQFRRSAFVSPAVPVVGDTVVSDQVKLLGSLFGTTTL